MSEGDRPEYKWPTEDDKIRDSLVGKASRMYHEYFDENNPEYYFDFKPRIMLAIDIVNGIGAEPASIALEKDQPKPFIPYANFDQLIEDIFRHERDWENFQPKIHIKRMDYLPPLDGYTDIQKDLIDTEQFISSDEFILSPQPNWIGRSVKHLRFAHSKGQNPHGEVWILHKYMGQLYDDIYDLDRELKLSA